MHTRKIRKLILPLSVYYAFVAFTSASGWDEATTEVTGGRTVKENSVETGTLTPSGIWKYRHLGSLTKKLILPNGEDINTWKAPHNMTSRFAVYVCGKDYDDKLFGVIEIGKWHPKDVFIKGQFKEYQYYVLQICHKLIQMVKQNALKTNQTETGSFIYDLQGLKLEEATYIPSVAFLLNLAREYRNILIKYLDEVIVINMTFIAEAVISTLRPAIGRFFERISIYGTEPSKYKAQLTRKFPKENLPEWYGGVKDFKPVALIG